MSAFLLPHKRGFSIIPTFLIGRASVPTLDQNLDLQRGALTKAGCERICLTASNGNVLWSLRLGGVWPERDC
ncbi:hypothetical protein [Methylobacterium longum]|uniref:Uncharacterized protein n=1 Tax=Methylobacterium longum TaxID=767694 RepID=A0ABT8AHR1_9HYPH|nr:hypothetical protein [Methylobacterium longum]MDN3569277.1 hypothetical protein [Methylobacterium longum]